MTEKMDFSPATWRLIKSPATSGAWNMAVDEAILESTRAGQSLPTLRLYQWAPACLSLGYAQPYSDVDLKNLNARGWDIVRRATGGRAILHTDELTYSVTGPENEPRLSGDILTSYRRLSKAILAGLEMLTLPVVAHPEKINSSSDAIEPVCFEIPSKYEITLNDKKLVGSAQARRQKGVLQHGTLPLTGDLTRITQVLNFSSEDAREKAAVRLFTKAITVENGVGKYYSWEEAARAFEDGFVKTLNLTFNLGDLTKEEKERAEELAENKYGYIGWTTRRKMLQD